MPDTRLPPAGPERLQDMLRAKRAPGNHSFKGRWIENLSSEPQFCSSHSEHRRMMKEANAVDIGDDGHAAVIEQATDRAHDNKKRKAVQVKEQQTHTGRMPDGGS